MKKLINLYLLLCLTLVMGGCEVVEGIFKGGMVVGILIVVLVIGLAVWLLRKVFGRKG